MFKSWISVLKIVKEWLINVSEELHVRDAGLDT